MALGDSLTQGWYNGGRNTHPYSIALQRCVDTSGASRYTIETAGVPGETSGELVVRAEGLAKAGRYEAVVVLSGTNDIGEATSAQIVANLQQIYAHFERAGSKLVLVTVPDSSHQIDWVIQKRNEVNAAIRAYCAAKAHTLVDLSAQLPYSREYWDDALHLNPTGYDRMGELIFAQLKELI
uniref:SGNH hydrolase-type esterase domain-containing protein n=1 Tax=Arcella intermedia TaxID=1963864 RepID=A0A6B2LKP0_9EUKA